MTKTVLKVTVLAAGAAGSLAAQRGGTMVGSEFQQAGTLGQPAPRAAVATPLIRQAVVTGKPFSGTEERKTTQTLADGTVIETSDNNLLYRDSQGRTRVEQTKGDKTTVRIMDPVAGFIVTLNPSDHTAVKTAMGGRGGGVGGAISRSGGGGAGGRMPLASPVPTLSLDERQAIEKQLVERMAASGQAAPAQSAPGTENLGVQNQNGVQAQGTRSTQIIPAGQIGNNREIRVTYDRWYSNDLRMVVKSLNTDPRFGTTSYQLTNISQTEPSPTLFQIPADYTVTENH